MILKDKTALITGGSRGIGKAVARAFLREGARVMLAAYSSEEELAKTAAELQEEFKKDTPTVYYSRCDVSDPIAVKRLIKRTQEVFLSEKIDIVVNAAGIYGPIGLSHEISLDEWRRTYEVNVFGTFIVVQEVVPCMIKNGGGKIINFSGGGDGPLPRFSAYNSSKVAVVRLTETLAEELKQWNIAVNAIAPGAVNTKFLDQALEAGEEKVGKKRYQELLKQKTEGGTPPEKTADLCVFLASSKSDGLTGKFLSAVWDHWYEWDEAKIKEIMSTSAFTIRRVDPYRKN